MFQHKGELKGKNDDETKKIQSGQKVIRELQRTFGFMTAGNKSYVKPTELINVLVDDYGNKV